MGNSLCLSATWYRDSWKTATRRGERGEEKALGMKKQVTGKLKSMEKQKGNKEKKHLTSSRGQGDLTANTK